MIKISGIIVGSSAPKQSIFNNAILLQSIRWRKRRWVPPHPSKEFFVPERKESLEPEEMARIRKRSNEYKTAMKSLMRYFEDEHATQRVQRPERQQSHEAVIQELAKENELWNEESARLRAVREEKERLDNEDEHIRRLINLEEQEEIRKEKAKRMVILEQKAAKHFINADNLEEEIEKALDSRASYNFAIDLEGNQYVGMPDEQSFEKSEKDHSVHSKNKVHS